MLALAAVLPLSTPALRAQTATIVVSDSVSFRFGMLAQAQADFTQNVRQDSSVAQSIFLRRIRLLMGGQIGPHLTFFISTDSPNLGRAGPGFNRSGSSPMIIQDAMLEVRPGDGDAFLLDAGLQYVPLCRQCAGSPSSILAIDFGSYIASAAPFTGLNALHDVGFMAKGYLNDARIEYRAGLFSGARAVTSTFSPVTVASNSLRAAGRVAIQLLDPEPKVYAYAGTYLGRKRVLSLGAGTDVQGDYRAYSADAFLSHPVGDDGVTAAATFIRYNGGAFFPLPKQDTFEAEGAWHFTASKITPWVKVEARRIDESQKSGANQDETRLQVGGTYYLTAHWLNFKAAYTRASLERLGTTSLTQNGLTFQLQAFFF